MTASKYNVNLDFFIRATYIGFLGHLRVEIAKSAPHGKTKVLCYPDN